MTKYQKELQSLQTRRKLLRDEILMLKTKERRIASKRERLQHQLENISGGSMNRAIGER